MRDKELGVLAGPIIHLGPSIDSFARPDSNCVRELARTYFEEVEQ